MATGITTTVVGALKPFDGSNFANWLFRLELILEANKVKDVLTELQPADDPEKKAFLERDVKARSLIVQHLSDSVLVTIKNQFTAKGMIDTLKTTFSKGGIAEQVRLKKLISQLEYKRDISLLQFFCIFENLVGDFKAAGGTMSNQEVVTALLTAMPSCYQSVTRTISILFHADPTEVTLDFLKNQLISEDERLLTDSKTDSTTNPVSFLGDKKTRFKKTNAKWVPKCWICNQMGHRKPDCPKRKKDASSNVAACQDSSKSSVPLSFLTTDGVPEACVCTDGVIPMVVDSGSTHHLVDCETGKLLKNCEPVHFEIRVAKKGATVTARRSGTLNVFLPGGRPIVIDNVIECEGLTKNLLSVRRLEQKGLSVRFEQDKVSVCDNVGTVVCEGSNVNNLYVLTFYSGTGAAFLTNEDVLMHRRMGHSSAYPTVKPCEICLRGKQTRSQFHDLPVDRKPKRILEAISTDVCGPLEVPTMNGMRYFVTFIDHWSHFCCVYPIKSKDQVYDQFKIYHAYVTSTFDKKIARLRCDSGGEYKSNRFKEFCLEQGISVEYTIPYTPEQNGVAERLNRTLASTVRCLLFDANLPKPFWGEAVLTAAFLINRRPTSSLDVTPAERWFGYAPNLSKIKLFGCLAHAHIDKELRRKLDDRSQLMVMVGYAPNGYRLWDLEKQQVVFKRNVVFDESRTFADVRHVELTSLGPLTTPVDPAVGEPVIEPPADPPDDGTSGTGGTSHQDAGGGTVQQATGAGNSQQGASGSVPGC
uniref:Copia protein n=1 Tax=Lygus hesperus TaxID=30085 RepID=A0A0A9WWP7_LYGHE